MISTFASEPGSSAGLIAAWTEFSLVLQRGRARGVRLGEIVPRPPFSERLVFERPVVADDAPADEANTDASQRFSPGIEHRRRVLIIQARIAGTDDHEIPVDDAVRNAADRHDSGLVREVPAKLICRGGKRDDLQVRRRHHETAGIERVQRFVRVERAHHDAPVAPAEGRGGNDGVDVALKRDGARRGGRERGRRRQPGDGMAGPERDRAGEQSGAAAAGHLESSSSDLMASV